MRHFTAIEAGDVLGLRLLAVDARRHQALDAIAGLGTLPLADLGVENIFVLGLQRHGGEQAARDREHENLARRQARRMVEPHD
jgi:hypothetical protein